MVSDEKYGIKGAVNALHHHQRPWPGPDDPCALVEEFDIDVLGVAVRIRHQYFTCARVICARNGRVDFKGHEPAKLLIVSALRLGLYQGIDAADALHVR